MARYHEKLLLACAVLAIGVPLSAEVTASAGESGQSERSVPPTKMPPLPPATFDESLAIGGEDIDARKLRSRMTVEVRVNKSGPYRFVVDSGADSSVVGERIAAALNLRPGQPTVLNGVTDSQLVDRVFIDELELGRTLLYDLEVPVLKERDIGAAGMLGLDALVEQRLMLDFEKRQVSVDDALTQETRMDGEIVVRARLQRGQLILTRVRANKVPVDAIVDTGSEISIGNTLLRDQLFAKGLRDLTVVKVTGVTGTTIGLDVVLVPILKLGPLTLRDVPMAFADIPPFEAFGINDRPSLLLGTDVMEVFRRVQLDFKERRVRFQLRKCDQVVRLRTASRYASRIQSESELSCSR